MQVTSSHAGVINSELTATQSAVMPIDAGFQDIKTAASKWFGRKYFPEAFDPRFLETARFLCRNQSVYDTYSKYIQLFLTEIENVVTARILLVDKVRQLVPETVPITNITWCTLCLVTDRYFADKARINSWTKAEAENIQERWYEILAKAFVPTLPDRNLDVASLQEWTNDFSRLTKSEA